MSARDRNFDYGFSFHRTCLQGLFECDAFEKLHQLAVCDLSLEAWSWSLKSNPAEDWQAKV